MWIFGSRPVLCTTPTSRRSGKASIAIASIVLSTYGTRTLTIVILPWYPKHDDLYIFAKPLSILPSLDLTATMRKHNYPKIRWQPHFTTSLKLLTQHQSYYRSVVNCHVPRKMAEIFIISLIHLHADTTTHFTHSVYRFLVRKFQDIYKRAMFRERNSMLPWIDENNMVEFPYLKPEFPKAIRSLEQKNSTHSYRIFRMQDWSKIKWIFFSTFGGIYSFEIFDQKIKEPFSLSPQIKHQYFNPDTISEACNLQIMFLILISRIPLGNQEHRFSGPIPPPQKSICNIPTSLQPTRLYILPKLRHEGSLP